MLSACSMSSVRCGTFCSPMSLAFLAISGLLLFHQGTLFVSIAPGVVPHISAITGFWSLIPIQSPSGTEGSESNCMFRQIIKSTFLFPFGLMADGDAEALIVYPCFSAQFKPFVLGLVSHWMFLAFMSPMMSASGCVRLLAVFSVIPRSSLVAAAEM